MLGCYTVMLSSYDVVIMSYILIYNDWTCIWFNICMHVCMHPCIRIYIHMYERMFVRSDIFPPYLSFFIPPLLLPTSLSMHTYCERFWSRWKRFDRGPASTSVNMLGSTIWCPTRPESLRAQSTPWRAVSFSKCRRGCAWTRWDRRKVQSCTTVTLNADWQRNPMKIICAEARIPIPPSFYPSFNGKFGKSIGVCLLAAYNFPRRGFFVHRVFAPWFTYVYKVFNFF